MTAAELKYLTAIKELYDGTVGIKLISIAAKMNVTKVSVYRAVERLENHGYIKRDEKNKVVMTEHGYEQLEKYNVLIGWLNNHLQKYCRVSAETAYNDAIGAVCAFSDETRLAIAEFMAKAEEKVND